MSLKSLYSRIKNHGLEFLLTYKFSQDHLKLFFDKIRSLSGRNNHPTARQFKAAYKLLLIHNELADVARGNCIPLEDIKISTVLSKT